MKTSLPFPRLPVKNNAVTAASLTDVSGFDCLVAHYRVQASHF